MWPNEFTLVKSRLHEKRHRIIESWEPRALTRLDYRKFSHMIRPQWSRWPMSTPPIFTDTMFCVFSFVVVNLLLKLTRKETPWLPKSRRFLASQLDSCGFSIGSRPMELVNSYLHLGHLISNKLEDDDDIASSQGQFIGQVNNVMTYFCKLDCFVRYRLFQSFCTSYYGCELWSLRSRKLTDFCHAWNKGVCRIWNLPYNTHCYALPILCECLPVSDEICCCMITKMCNSWLNSDTLRCLVWDSVWPQHVMPRTNCIILYATIQL